MNKKDSDLTKRAIRDMILDYVPYLIIIAFIIIIRMYIAEPVRVNGSSMDPTLKDGDIMLLYKLKKRTKGVNRFDIVVVKADNTKIIKRVIGLPGETIKYEIITDENNMKSGVLYVDGKRIQEDFITEEAKLSTCYGEYNICEEAYTIPANHYFVMGDNRLNSKDSRFIGAVSDDIVSGTTEVIIFPFSRFGNVTNKD